MTIFVTILRCLHASGNRRYTPAIRKLIYTTNTVEGYHRQVRKVTKTLAYHNICKKWTMPIANWGQISQQLAIKFGDRFKIM